MTQQGTRGWWRRLARARPVALALTFALLTGLLVVLTPAVPARAAGTVLFQNNFVNRTVDGTGTVSIPTASGGNAVCLSASGNTTVGPLYSCTTSTDTQGSGKLRLTRAVTNQTGGVFGATSFPTSSGLDVTFNTFQYGGTGADGMSFVLGAVDPTNPVAPTTSGPSGGALGYSPGGSVSGLANAYLGVGLDVYGNFSSTSYQGSGCTNAANITAQTAGAVVVRGPGNGTVGYCGLSTTYTGVASSKVTLRATTRAASAVPVQVLINPGATTFTSDTGQSASPGTYKVIVTPVGTTAKTLTGTLPTVPTGLYPSTSWLNANGVPKQLVFGFFGSTGSVTDFHEASELKVVTFNTVPQLAVDATSYVAASPALGAPVNYVINPSVQPGSDVNKAISVTQTVPTGVTPVGAFGAGWVCAAPSGQTVTCTTSATSFTNGTNLPPVNVVAIVTGSGVTASTVQSGSISAVSSDNASPATDTSTTVGTLPTAPSGVSLSRTAGSISNANPVTVSGSNLSGATAIEIGTTTEQQTGKPVTLLPCSSVITSSCFTVSGNDLVVSSWPTRTAAAVTSVTVVSLGVAGAAAYTYADRPGTVATPTATAGDTRATVVWTAPTANNSPITGYVVTPYLNGTAQTPISYDVSTTTRTLTGLTAGGSYTFTVGATNAYGTATSAQSSAVVPYTLPGAPTAVTAAASTSAATVSWTAPSSNGFSPLTGYVVTPYIGATAQTAQTFSGTATTQTVTGLTPGTAYTFTVAAQNAAGTGPPSTRTTAITPNAAPTLTFAAPPGGEVGVAYSRQLTVNDGTSPFVWSVSAGSLPAGLSLGAGTGLLSGTPTTAGSSTVTVTVTDASGQTATRSVTLVIVAAPTVTFSPAAGEVTVAYSQTPTVSGGTAPYVWSVRAGSLPGGLSIDPATGRISGPPTGSGTYPVTIGATDAFDQTATRTVSVVIAAVPTFTFTAPPAGRIGVAYSTSLDVSGGTAPLVWSIQAGSLPAGLSLNTSTGVVSGTPTTAGTSVFTVAVVDAFNVTASKQVSLVINPGPVVITKTANASSAVAGGTVAYTITVANTGTSTVSGISLADPLGGVLDDATYNANATASSGTVGYSAPTLSWTGSLAAGATATITYSVTVNNPVTGNQVLANTVSASSLGTNCPAGATDTRCTATVTLAGLGITSTADVATTTPGSTVGFRIVLTNTGQTPYAGATFSQSLSGVLDDATYNADATASTGSVSYAGGSLSWTGNLAVGASATITYSAKVNDPDAGNRRLTTTVVSSTAGSVCPSGNPAASCSTSVTVLVPALSITTATSVATTIPGGSVGYTLTIANTGQTPYAGSTVALALAGALDDATVGTAFTASSGTVAFDAGTGVVTWTGSLAVGATATVSGVLTVRNPDPGDRVLTTVASSTAAGSTCPAGSTAPSCSTTVRVLQPALTIVTSASTTTTTPGSVVTYTVTATNSGQTDYTAATFDAPLTGVLDDAVFNGDAVTTSGTVSYASSTLTWRGDLAVGATATVTYSVTVRNPDPGDHSLTGTVTSSTPFSTCAAGSPAAGCTSTVPVLEPRLALTTTADVASTVPGGVVTYTVRASNTGETAYTGTTVALDLSGVLDEAVYDADAVASTGSLSLDAQGNLTWTLDLAVGASATTALSVTVRPAAQLADRSLVSTVASPAQGSACPTSPANAGCRLAVAVLLPGLVITKTADRSTVTPGEAVAYTLVIRNSGETTQAGATVTDSLAQVLTDAVYAGGATATAGQVSYTAPNLVWTGTLAPGASATVSYQVTVRDPDPGDKRLLNTAVSNASGSNCADGSTDTRCTATVSVLVPGLTIAKTADVATTTPGATVTYTVTVTNSGATAYTGATFADALAGVLDDASVGTATASVGTVTRSGATLSWTGDLAIGASATIRYPVTVAADGAGDNALRNTVTSTTRGSNCASGSSDPRCTSVVPVARLTITQAYTETSTTPGSLVHLRATFTNTGQVPYNGITVSSPNADTLDDAVASGDQAASSGTLVLSSTAITWTGNIGVGETVTVTGTLTVNNPDTGNRVLTGTTVSNAPGSNCPTGGTDSRCTARLPVLVPQLSVTASANTPFAVPGGTVRYTTTIANTGETPYVGATVTNNLTGLLDDAVYNTDATATRGTVSYTAPTLTWTGDLAVGATATVTYTVTTRRPPTGDKTMSNPVSSSDVGSTCPPATGSPSCRTTVAVLTPVLTLTKTADTPSATLGSQVGYTIKVTNSGQTSYASAAFTDDLAGVLDDATVTTAPTASAGTVSFTSGVVSWSGALAVGASATITYAVTTKNPAVGDRSMVNTVVSSTDGTNCAAGGTDSRCTVTVPVANSTTVTFAKTANVAFATPGSVVTYTVRVANGATTGPVGGASFSDPLAAVLDDATYNDDAVASSGTVAYDPGSTTLSWSTGALALDTTVTVTYSVTTKSAVAGNQILSNTITSSTTLNSQNCASGSTDSRCTSAVPIARLLISQAYTQASTTPGSLVRLNATFTNTGAYAYNGITVTSPSADTVDDAVPTGDQTASSGTLVLTSTAITWTGNIPVGGTVTVTGTLTVDNPDTGNRVLTGTLVSAAPGNNCTSGSGDSRCTSRLPVLLPQLSVTKTANTTFVVPGGTASYTITVANTGETPYVGASVTDSLAGVLDDAVYNDDATVSRGTVTYASSTLTWTGDLAVGATATLTYSVTAYRPSTGDKVMVNRAVSGDVGSTCPPASGSASCRTSVAVLTPVLTLESTADVTTAVPGDVVHYTVRATNSGQIPFSPASFTVGLGDVVDDATYAGDVTASVGTAQVSGSGTTTQLSWSGTLAVGATATITYSVTVAATPGDYRLDQVVTSTTAGSTCVAGSTDTRCRSTVAVAGLRITNLADVSAAKPTDVVHYVGTFTNLGQVPYVGITVTDSFADALDDATYNGDAAATSGSLVIVPGSGRIVWTGDVPVGATVTITGSVTVNNPAAGNKVLRTRTSTDAPASNCPSGATDPRCTNTVTLLTPELTITRSVGAATATPGSLVTATVTIDNTGQTSYQGARVTSLGSGNVDDATYAGDATATAGTVGLVGDDVVWTGDLAVGATVTVRYSVRVNNPDLGDKVLVTTTVSDDLGSTCPTGTTDPQCTTRVEVLTPALDLAITADRTTTTPGGTVGYTFTITNAGQTAYVGATATAQLAGALDDATSPADAATTVGSVAVADGVLSWNGDLPVGASAVVSYTLVVADPDAGDRRLVTAVSSSAAFSSCTSAAPCANTVTVLVPGLAVSTTADVATATPGDLVTFTLDIADTGETPYRAAVVTTDLSDLVDDAALEGSVTASAGSVTVAGSELRWTGDLAPGDSVVVRYRARVSATLGNHVLVAAASSTEAQSSCPAGTSNPACQARVTVLVPGLTLATTADRTTTTPGSTVSYTTTISNSGETAYAGARVQQDLTGLLVDAQYNADAVVTGGGVLTYSGGKLVWTGALPVGASAVVTFSATVDDPDTGDKVLLTRVSSTDPGSSCPPAATASACSSSVTVLVPAVQLTKVADRSRVVAGRAVQYTVTVRNTGQVAYAPATFVDDLTGVLDDATFGGGATATSGTVGYANSRLTWSGPLAVGASATITYSVTARLPAVGNRTLANTVTSASAGSTCVSGQESSCHVEVSVAVPRLSVSKSADVTRVVAGATVHYLVQASNTGEADYPSVTLDDDLAAVLDDAVYAGDATASRGTVTLTGSTLRWTGALARGDSVLLTYSVAVNPTTTGDNLLVNRVSSAALGSTCPPTGTVVGCSTSTTVDPAVLGLTGLTDSFSLLGGPGSTVSKDEAVTMTVTTNNPGGYVVTAQGTTSTLVGGAGNPDTIPLGNLGVRETGSTLFQRLTTDSPVTVHRQNGPSGPSGDAVSNDYQVQIPFVSSDTYTTTVEYIATAQ